MSDVLRRWSAPCPCFTDGLTPNAGDYVEVVTATDYDAIKTELDGIRAAVKHHNEWCDREFENPAYKISLPRRVVCLACGTEHSVNWPECKAATNSIGIATADGEKL